MDADVYTLESPAYGLQVILAVNLEVSWRDSQSHLSGRGKACGHRLLGGLRCKHMRNFFSLEPRDIQAETVGPSFLASGCHLPDFTERVGK